jgi:hypothetical protein
MVMIDDSTGGSERLQLISPAYLRQALGVLLVSVLRVPLHSPLDRWLKQRLSEPSRLFERADARWYRWFKQRNDHTDVSLE